MHRRHSLAASSGILTAGSGQTKGSGDGLTFPASRIPTTTTRSYYKRNGLAQITSKQERAVLLPVKRSSRHPRDLGDNLYIRNRGPTITVGLYLQDAGGSTRCPIASRRTDDYAMTPRNGAHPSPPEHRPKRLAGQGDELKTSAKQRRYVSRPRLSLGRGHL